MRKNQIDKLVDNAKEVGGFLGSFVLLICFPFVGVAVLAFCIIIYAPYSAVREQIERRRRPLQLTNSQ